MSTNGQDKEPSPSNPILSNYRNRIYQKYASREKAGASGFDPSAADRWGRTYDHYLRDWLPPSTDARIGDLACGAGSLLHFFKTRGYRHLEGVDLSGEQVRIARAVVPDVVEGDVVAFLNARPDRFDLLTAFDVIEHLTKDEVFAFLDACRSALRPGGRLVIQTPNADSPFIGTIRYGDFTHETCFNPNSLHWLLGLCGFRGFESRECEPRPHGAKSLVRYVLWKGIHAYLRLYNMIETGSSGSRVYTRVFLTSGIAA